ncbi:hypothetical protein RHMOL_Rhmol13G0096300 [Rhododendron molle]|uniref:Uncharacterized protein n=4 Tax=Rhododendron molle TaxID=49168 RepID=A0ACC0L5Y3_RHOML|nr:hypothetical protein RHMOL_Rhmol13G0096300 [Rhododendron molle]KAI8523748.1 hypothetical protein RHMOL_Rhmol13G0096300 [Rhododendron molle]KAI8523749.1 hypothetical protein RHMOL_Rhmol13G0096300 [Rhododendron molle]KAI8523750.1 hypothetical protein RHMOL_Rhmol13G0096300 [Rhododendron molle]
MITLLVMNSTISFIEENNAGNAAAALMAHHTPKGKLARLRNWKSIMICLCCSNDDMQWPSHNAQFMGNNASEYSDLYQDIVLVLIDFPLGLVLYEVVKALIKYHLFPTETKRCCRASVSDRMKASKGDLNLRTQPPAMGGAPLFEMTLIGLIFFFRPYEVIITGTHKQIPIWHLGLNPNLDGKLSTEKVWKMEWNISGMTLATTGGDGVSMIELSRTQDEGVGDGTTSVIVLACEMLHVTEAFIDKSFHPTVICRAYGNAFEDAIAVLDKIAMPIDVNDHKLQHISIAMHLDTASFWCHNDGVGEELYRHKVYQSIWGSDCSVMQMEGLEYLKESCSSVLTELL